MKVEKYLILNKYLLSLLGVDEFKDLQEKLKDTQTDYDSDDRSYFVNVLRSLEGLKKDKLSETTLLKYDKNIRWYEEQINRKRQPKISLKYFQYLAILFTEIFLDNLKNRPTEFLYELNQFLENYKKEKGVEIIEKFTEKDLEKLAFWMATGSGKNSIIMTINFYQFFRYKLFSPDNILLITPNEGLSKQHFDELQKSSIPCRLYSGNISHLSSSIGNQGVLILEITKLVEEKKGGGVTLPVEVFEGRNLVFVDEGHKGRTSEEQTWKRLRDAVSKNGFVFEYSATFGQILSERNKAILEEYAKAIVFNYSYKYFYLDGYGKDFSVLNIRQLRLGEREFQETMFIANLLAFYEQVLVYEENKNLASEYNLEKPLWIFVGTTVTGKQEESDVIQIVEFLNKVIKDKEWAQRKSEKILSASSELKNEDGTDIFDKKFGYLKDRGFNFNDVYQKVFSGRGNFSIYEIKNAEGELGLKIGENDYFGVVNIGSVSKFKKQLGKKGITVNQDVISGSLFDTIKEEDSRINILVGSKKFIEGWDTWRVSSMGLLNIGIGQGPQIIQLFGRGVRLKGRGFSLKRSSEKTPVQFLESLNIYGIKADYLNRFLDTLSREEIEFETIEIPVEPQHQKKWKTLYTLTKNENRSFEEEVALSLRIDRRIKVGVNLLPKITAYQGLSAQEVESRAKVMKLPEETLEMLDWEKILREIYDFTATRGYWNLTFSKETFKNILLSDRYKILAPAEMLKVESEKGLRRIEEIALLVIKKYMESFYRKYHKRYETDNMQYGKLARQTPLFVFGRGDRRYTYKVQVNKDRKKLIRDIKKLAKDFKKFCQDDDETLPRVYFDRHLYVPVLLEGKKIEKITPAGLVKSEKRFILDLRKYLKNNKEKFTGLEIYLLRNFPKSGVGFFNLSGFYPDFILWLKNGRKQRVIFVDPKGLEHTKGLDDQKIRLREDIKGLEKKLGEKDISLDSFILSKTEYDKLTEGKTTPESKEEYVSHNVLFLSDKDWPEYLFAGIEKEEI